MINKLETWIKDLAPRKLEKFILDETIKIIKETDELFLDQNRDNLSNSKRSDGSTITPFYAPSTAKRKQRQAPNLFDTGEFYNNFFLKADKKGILIESKRESGGIDIRAHLLEKYGENRIEKRETPPTIPKIEVNCKSTCNGSLKLSRGPCVIRLPDHGFSIFP